MKVKDVADAIKKDGAGNVALSILMILFMLGASAIGKLAYEEIKDNRIERIENRHTISVLVETNSENMFRLAEQQECMTNTLVEMNDKLDKIGNKMVLQPLLSNTGDIIGYTPVKIGD